MSAKPTGAGKHSVPSLVVIKVSKQHILGDGPRQGGHGLVVLRDHLQRESIGIRYSPVNCQQPGAGGRMKRTGERIMGQTSKTDGPE